MAARVRALRDRAGLPLECRELALSNAPGEAVLETVHGYDGTSRLAAGAGDSPAAGLRVRLSTLDAELPEQPVDLMKIDVEGWEPEVIEGGARVLARTRHLIVEAHSAAHLQRIQAALGPQWSCLRLSPCDYLFSRS
jgi:FkbM family methyltransferase